MTRLALALACALLASCVLVPHTVHGYDPECRIAVRRMELQPVQLASIQHCHNEGCLGHLLT